MNTSAAETLQEIARQLVDAREAQNMTLEEVATKTFIPMRILKALEAAETFKLPEPIFVQGFIKRYAKLVGLDGDALAQKIPLEQAPIAVNIVKEPAARELVPPINRRVSLSELNGPTPHEADSSKNGMNSDTRSSDNPSNDRPTWLIPALAGLVGIAAVSTSALFFNRPQTATEPPKVPAASSKPSVSPKPKPSAIAAAQPPLSPTPSPSPSLSPSVTPSSSPSPNAAPGPVNVGLNLSDESWVEVRADGEVVFEGTMQKGATQNWSAKKEIEVSSGNAGAVTISQNKQPGKVMGAMGDIKTMTFSGKSTP